MVGYRTFDGSSYVDALCVEFTKLFARRSFGDVSRTKANILLFLRRSLALT